MKDAAKLRETEEYLQREIPLTAAMGVRILSCDEAGLTIGAPLAENHNHLGTAFGGSISALAILAGYAFLWIEVDDPSAHVVIQEASVRFRRPIRSELRAKCTPPGTSDLQRFREELKEARTARIELEVTLGEAGQCAVVFRGTYVATRPSS